MVTFPAVIESGSEAKLCVSLLRPNETLQMTIYLIHNNHSRTLVEETVEEEFHRCSQFKAPEVDGQSLQEIKVQVKGESFEMTKKSRVLFKSYSKLTFIQTDKPIYNPGQTGLILQLSHKLNSEAPQGLYKLKANIGNKLTEHHFKVKKYVLPKFEVTIKAPEQQSVGEEELKLEICGKYTYGQPVSGKALLRVCRPFWRYAYYEDVPMISLCLTETVELSRTGCAFPSFNISTFMNTEMESNLQDSLVVTATVTEEGTAISMVKSENIQLTFQIGKVEFLDLPKTFERGTILEGKVLSKGAIIHHGYEKVEVKDSSRLREGKLSFELSISTELAPTVQVLAYCVLPSENIIGASKNFGVEKCFKNKVSLQFSPSRAVPGEENTLQLSALPGSLCGLSAVDQSVFIMEPRDRLNTDTIFNLLPVTSVVDYPSEVKDEVECLHESLDWKAGIDYVYDALKSVGLQMATNLVIAVPYCHNEYEFMEDLSLVLDEALGSAISGFLNDVSPLETVRTFFPETWIWQLVEVGDSGSAQVPVTVPDTITTWETEAFCLSPQGLGLAPPAELTVFQPFFLELSLPYSIIRGEIFELKATVFNYFPKCILVKVTPAPSTHYTLKASSDGQYSSCLCASGRKTFKWTLTPSVLGVMNVTVSAEAEQSQTVCDNEIVSVPERGRIDTVTRSLVVQAEGTEKTKCQSWLLCPQGDILGRALKNIDGLLRMPYGCGEQNIALLSPNIYILQYLQNTGQLTEAIRERATEFLKSGYQRQLNYKHFDGAYSTFGRGEGNTCAKTWLIKKQRPDGCFIRQGRLFNNRMKGGVNDDVTMTAYITASLFELGAEVMDPAVSEGLRCLKSTIGNLTNTYTTALLAYTFSLAGENDARDQLLTELDSVAISGDGRLHWSQSASDNSDSLAVEISSYVLLAVLTTDQLSTADLGYANRIVSWLVRQQNPYGGFSSTQDTVVALQALALYSTKVFSSDGSSTVTVKSAGGDSHRFDVHQNNKLLYQEKPLQDVPGKYSIDVKGSTCVSVQVALFYNIPTPTETSTLHIKAEIEGNCTKSFRNTLSLFVSVIYNGTLPSTNMVIVDIKLLSGFTADPSAVPRNIPMYYQLFINQVLPVQNLKPAVIKVYDYYQTNVTKYKIIKHSEIRNTME
ncbi:hypothetical protein P4O66_003133 [Electrophorus voltai]|uniref:Alpha-2-macroglobulin-like n=1 Tax=Electrophorus voltai TaxID=2609070 RepID=A0AAD9DMF6_9TELE|nr:hypothetical protein P4O66_003133 [Electrophorus voltai]